ncbi:hypothetical protein KHP62_10415 [Rhodobacteraceae bacterium NNCM2]|nr:hypothetical protein [Coraliihabitans acroporae]
MITPQAETGRKNPTTEHAARSRRVLRPAIGAAALAVTGLSLGACDTRTTIDKIGLSSKEVREISTDIFDEFCLASLPQMEGMQDKFTTIVTEKFGAPPSLNREVYGVASYGDPKITVSRGTPEWRDFEGEYRCEVTAAEINPEQTAIRVEELFEKRAGENAVMTLTEAKPDGAGERLAWTVSGSKPGMRLEITTSVAAGSGGSGQTGMRLAWRE